MSIMNWQTGPTPTGKHSDQLLVMDDDGAVDGGL